MVYIHRPPNPGSGITEATAFIQCIDGQETHIHELWCLGLDNTSRKVHPTAQVQVITGTVGNFVTDYLAENGRIIQIIGKLSANNSVQYLGVPDQCGGIGLPFISNLQAHIEATGWGSANNPNQDWGGSILDAYSMTNVT